MRSTILSVIQAAFLASGLTAMGAVSAAAQDPQSASRAFADAFKVAFAEQSAPLVLCIGGQAGADIDMTFIGAPAPAIHIAEHQRRTLNDTAVQVLNGLRPFRVISAEPTGQLAPLLQGTAGNLKLQKTLSELYTSPAFVKFRIQRPAAEIIQIEVDILGRKPGGAYSCPFRTSLYLDAETFEVRPAPASDRGLMPFKGAFREAMRRLIPKMQTSESATISATAELPGSCNLERAIEPILVATYFDHQAATDLLPELTGQWPNVTVGANGTGTTPDTTAQHLSLHLVGDANEPGVGYATFELRVGNVTRDFIRLPVILPKEQLTGCEKPEAEEAAATEDNNSNAGDSANPDEPASADAADTAADNTPAALPQDDKKALAEDAVTMGREDASLVLYSDRSAYAIGEPMQLFVVPPVDCRLTIINIDDEGRSCVAHPLAAYGVPDEIVKAQTVFQFPPADFEMVAPSGRFQKFVALCNASAEAKVAEVRDTTDVACTEGAGAGDRNPEQVLETIVIRRKSADAADAGPRALPSNVLRRSITVRIEQ